MGLASGDFVFVGDLGRPDLLETAAGKAGAAEPSARRLFGSARRFLDLPDYLQVWPAHGAGSACGKALGAVPQSTVGYEKRFNPALLAAKAEGEFLRFILEGQPEPPLYFARMKRDNKLGPPILGALPRPARVDADALAKLDTRATAVIDTRPWKAFRAAHLPGALYIPLNAGFTTDAGSLVAENEPIVLIVEPARLDEAVRDLIRIGLDNIVGWTEPGTVDEAGRGAVKLASTPEVDVAAAKDRIASGDFVLDVRRATEFAQGHIPNALNTSHTRLAAHLDRVPRDRRILVNCQAGGRSARACALLQRHGYDVANLAGGFAAWEQGGGPTEH